MWLTLTLPGPLYIIGIGLKLFFKEGGRIMTYVRKNTVKIKFAASNLFMPPVCSH